MKQCIINFIKRPWSNEEKFLVVLSSTLLGLLLGLVFSPNGGLHLLCNNGSNNGTNNKNNGNKKNDNEEDDDDDDDILSFN